MSTITEKQDILNIYTLQFLRESFNKGEKYAVTLEFLCSFYRSGKVTYMDIVVIAQSDAYREQLTNQLIKSNTCDLLHFLRFYNKHVVYSNLILDFK